MDTLETVLDGAPGRNRTRDLRFKKPRQVHALYFNFNILRCLTKTGVHEESTERPGETHLRHGQLPDVRETTINDRCRQKRSKRPDAWRTKGPGAQGSGSIRIGGEDVADKAPAERGIAMVFQTYALYPHKTVAGNMGYGLKLAGRPKAEIAAEVLKVAKTLELDGLLATVRHLKGDDKLRHVSL